MKTKILSTGTKLAYKVAYAIIGIAIIFVLWIGYLIFNPVNILEVEVPIPATPTEVQAGDIINLNFDYCKHEPYNSYIKVDFIGDYVIPTLSTTRSFQLGCHSESLAVSIPAGSPDGIYKIRLEIDYQVNVLRQERYIFDSVDIRVINDRDQEVIEVGESEERIERES